MNVQLAALTDGSALKTWLLIIIGNFFIILIAARGVGHFMKQQWGELITMIVAGVVVAGFVYFPDTAIALLGDIWTKVSGNA
ncbi:TcpD family membrane protein [Kitasatospora sp. NPDC004723]|uniref:TcpD family membrane protein n=1 Tax=Kitasatospora sp. NPDC004723 TaxID=3154288 RepID=UPI0033BB4F29